MILWLRKRFWYSSWRTKLYLGIGCMTALVLGGFVFTTRRFGDWSLLWTPLAMLLGFCAGRCFGWAVAQRYREQREQLERPTHDQP